MGDRHQALPGFLGLFVSPPHIPKAKMEEAIHISLRLFELWEEGYSMERPFVSPADVFRNSG